MQIINFKHSNIKDIVLYDSSSSSFSFIWIWYTWDDGLSEIASLLEMTKERVQTGWA